MVIQFAIIYEASELPRVVGACGFGTTTPLSQQTARHFATLDPWATVSSCTYPKLKWKFKRGHTKPTVCLTWAHNVFLCQVWERSGLQGDLEVACPRLLTLYNPFTSLEGFWLMLE